MATAAAQARRSERDARAALRERLEARRDEIEDAALTRIRAVADTSEVDDPAYAEGLRSAVAAAVDYGIETTGREGRDPPLPVALLAQARIAARVGISLDTVLRRYFAGYSLLGYFILEEASNVGITDNAELKRLLGVHAGLFDRLLAAVGEEHAKELEARALSTSARRAERVERLLAGELVDTADIPYELAGWHLGLVASGAGAEGAVRDLTCALDCRLLLLRREEGTIWAWLGTRGRLDPADLMQAPALHRPAGGDAVAVLSLGEPGEDLAGWRLSHRQAAAAFPVARLGGKRVARYADVALLASLLRDDLLLDSLYRLYLAPLERERDGGVAARRTLRAYIAAERNVTSAAAALGVNRNTVASRLRTIEKTIARPLSSCVTELEAVLRLEELTHPFCGLSNPAMR